ncbi:MAG: PepSY-like domain-containing protein [Alistipes sp.]|nr:PepSY-like domain-containing protein [Alistipes sp.]
MKRLFLAFIVVAAMTLGVGCEKYDAPSSARNAFKDQYPTAVDVEWERKHGYAVVDFYIPGTGECEAWYKKDGTWMMTSFDMRYNDLPQAVRTAFESAYGTETPVDDVNRVERSKGDTIYMIETTVVVNGYLTDIYLDYSADGTLLRTTVDIDNYDGIYYYI